ncbi:IS4/Tn5 family transposase DNA-binding protein, partial [Rhodopirellula baltica]
MLVQWVGQEFESLELGDKRRVDRVVKFVSEASSIGESTPDRTRSKADLKGIYRLAGNPKVIVDQIFDAHHQTSRKRCGEHQRVYLVQDTTEFDLTKP